MIGMSVGSGQCVSFVHAAIATPASSLWSRGAAVKGNPDLKPESVIAVFDDDGEQFNVVE